MRCRHPRGAHSLARDICSFVRVLPMREGLGTEVEQSGTAALPRASGKSAGALWLWMSLEG